MKNSKTLFKCVGDKLAEYAIMPMETEDAEKIAKWTTGHKATRFWVMYLS